MLVFIIVLAIVVLVAMVGGIRYSNRDRFTVQVYTQRPDGRMEHTSTYTMDR